MIPNVLSIAGSDPSGGAGIQADLKTFAAHGAYGCAVLTALTAQNTKGVDGVHPVPPAFVAAQIDCLFADLRIDAVKIGMLGSSETIDVVAAAIRRHRPPIVVLDPVMVAKSGDRLLSEDAVGGLRRTLLPMSTVLTPNLDEAGVLLDRAQTIKQGDMKEIAKALHRLGPRWIYLKGGHLPGTKCPDLAFDGTVVTTLPGRRIQTRNTHGTGCTLSAAIAARLARGEKPLAAFRSAKAYVGEAIARAGELSVGMGHGPLHHFHALWSRSETRRLSPGRRSINLGGK
ncbi:MAG: bifunctional hydroxymethylpyrimidine kinase/phosphomethylpyrimidine kinase [Alphaproteobacteria bacterium]|nr:bifunctional hydroxymethylpyrimidine kinase/phosphomethylpyrimidine kinase [Alphaproteobacteria bacterium]